MTLIRIIRWIRRTGAAVMAVQDLDPPSEMETIMKNFAPWEPGNDNSAHVQPWSSVSGVNQSS
ncbi:MAG: hypothetical protein KDB71_08455 [Mycobacterium sp.]|nr:hypothetical protein [Mycobacterium sp.]